MKLFSVKYYYNNSVDITTRRAIVCAKDEDAAEKILIDQEEKIYDTSVDIVSVTRVYLKEPKVVLIREE